MLDYAANAVVYWPIEQMQAQFERRCLAEQREPSEVFAESLGPEADPDDFWQQAKTNLQAGKIRMVFVADKIPTELQRIVEFLNGQMDPAQVLAVEVKQYLGQGQRAMVPRVLGQTAEAQQKKAAGTRPPRRQWDEEAFLQALATNKGPDVAAVAQSILRWANEGGIPVKWGMGGTNGTYYPRIDHAGTTYQPMGISTAGTFGVGFWGVPSDGPFGSEAKRLEYWARLNQIEGVNLSAERVNTWTQHPLDPMTDPTAMRRFLDTLDWFVQEVRAS
jgi:hypothetical protein